MKAALILSFVALGVGGTYLAQEPVSTPVVIQQDKDVNPLEKARRATFLITLPGYGVSGSAVLVGRKKLDNGRYRYTALTAYHVVKKMVEKFGEDKTKADHTMKMMFQPNFHGRPLRIKLAIDDIEWAIPVHDWAAIMFEMEHKLSCVQLATKKEFKAIKPFERIYAVGCGGGYAQLCRNGVIGTTHNEYNNTKIQLTSKRSWNQHTDKFFRPYINGWYGDSGGGVYNKDGKLIGIINGAGIMANWRIPVAHSTIALKAYVILDIIQNSKDFFLVED